MKILIGVCLSYSLFCSGLAGAHAQLDVRVQHMNDLLAPDLNAQLASQTNNAHLLLQRGELHSENHHWGLAWQDFQSAMDSTDDANLRIDIWFYMGRMRLQSGMPDEAYNLLSKVIKLEPSYKSARLNLARTYIELNDYRAAVDEMDIFMSLLQRPTPDQYIERANMAELIDNDGEGLVIEGLNEAVNQLGPIVSLVDLLVDSYLEQDKREEALRVIELLPHDVNSLPRWQLKKGDIYQELKQYLDAETAYKYGLNSISQMPEHRRLTPAIEDLKSQLEAKFLN
ncbi:tetratricopeptide repeat protein [Shewanella psychropiezotolerans]|uniref:Tetratricopeptide repeat protein n=1 Tax=Shewanella psychropiezotolerans TaxID=2593655 RepID=A0ABX5WZR7_9GAMM|nr:MULTISPECIES: tetratricopeptide repeat protein [Shewanella]MPY26706.1 tetratricopeptide repeat protein [Shewanella sp. YLB-07]QDO83692.1 tetratricopeptide repeat protein [Shewanella psychropiezotolerans]